MLCRRRNATRFFSTQVDSLVARKSGELDSLRGNTLPMSDTVRRDTVKAPKEPSSFLDAPIYGKNSDSLVYDVRNKLVYIYNEGDITYEKNNLKADFMRIDMDKKLVYAYGKADSLDGERIVTKPEFTEGSEAFQMDTITYNLDSKRRKSRAWLRSRAMAGWWAAA